MIEKIKETIRDRMRAYLDPHTDSMGDYLLKYIDILENYQLKKLPEAIQEFKEKNPVKSYWLEGEYVEETIPIEDIFTAGVKWIIEK